MLTTASKTRYQQLETLIEIGLVKMDYTKNPCKCFPIDELLTLFYLVSIEEQMKILSRLLQHQHGYYLYKQIINHYQLRDAAFQRFLQQADKNITASYLTLRQV